MSKYFSLIVLMAVIVILAVLFYQVMAGFLIPLFLAALLVVIFRPIHVWILEKCGGREKIAAGLTTASILLMVLVPLGLLIMLAVDEGRDAYRSFSSTTVLRQVSLARDSFGLTMPAEKFHSIDNDFIRAKDTNSSDPKYENLVHEIENHADQIGKYYGLVGDEAIEDGSAAEAEWQTFQEDLAQLSKASSDEENDGEEPTNEVRNGLEAAAAAASFKRFENKVLGGRIVALLKQKANPTQDDIDRYTTSANNFLTEQLVNVGRSTGTFLGGLVIGCVVMIISLYFFLLDGPKMIESIKGLSPIDDAHEQELVDEFNRVSRAVVVATLLAAIVQGLLGGIGYYFAGLDSIFLLTLTTGCLALVPFVGAAAVWVPSSLFLILNGHIAAGIGLGLYGATVISMADNVIKPLVLHGQSNLHPLLALLSVLGGVVALGPIGILIGPMIVAFLQTLLEILQRELKTIDASSKAHASIAQLSTPGSGAIMVSQPDLTASDVTQSTGAAKPKSKSDTRPAPKDPPPSRPNEKRRKKKKR